MIGKTFSTEIDVREQIEQRDLLLQHRDWVMLERAAVAVVCAVAARAEVRARAKVCASKSGASERSSEERSVVERSVV
jgi:hypothetical protein